MGLLSRMGRAATALSKYYYPFTWRNKPSIESPINEVHLNHIEDGINEMDNRILILAQDKADATDIANVFVDFAMDDTTGVMTFTRFDGSKVEHDSAVEKIALNCYLEDDNFVLELADGTKQKVSLSKFIDTYEFSSTDTIRITVNGKNISAEIPDGKITLAKLEPTIMSTIRQYTLDAQTAQGVAEQAAGTAQGWAIGGTGFEDNNAKHYASKSQRYAVGGVEEGDTEDNAKYYCQQAQAAAEQATGAAGFDGTAATVSAIDTQGVAVRKASGTGHVTITDAAEHPILNLNLAGKSEQRAVPSPDYPQPIISTGVVSTGAQLFDASKIPTKSAGGATVTNNGDGSFTVSGSGNLTEEYFCQYRYTKEETLKLVKPGKYSMTFSTVYPLMDFIVQGTGVIKAIRTSTKAAIEITEADLAVEDVYLTIDVYGKRGKTIVPGTIKPMVWARESIPTDMDWEPYTGGKPSPSPEYPQPLDVTVTGDNLFDASKVPSKTVGGATVTNNGDGRFTISGNGALTAMFKTSYKLTREEVRKIFKPGLYTLSALNKTYPVPGFAVRSSVDNTTVMVDFGLFSVQEKTAEITQDMIDNEDLYFELYFYGSSGNAIVPGTVTPMLNASDTALPWQPYQSCTASITLTEPLRGIGDHKDMITMTKRIDRCVELVFDGSENWAAISTYEGFYYAGILPFSAMRRAGLCNQFPVDTKGDAIESVRIGNGNSVLFCVYSRFYDDAAADKGLSAWKAHLAVHPLKVVTYLDTSVETDLDATTVAALNALTTYTGTTHVTVTAGGPEPDVGLGYFGQPGDKVTVQDMCDSFAAPAFDDSGVVQGISGFGDFLNRLTSGVRFPSFFRDLKAGLKFVLHTGQLVNNGLCNEPGKYPLDAAYGRTLLEMIGNTADLPGGAADIVSAIVTQNSNLGAELVTGDMLSYALRMSRGFYVIRTDNTTANTPKDYMSGYIVKRFDNPNQITIVLFELGKTKPYYNSYNGSAWSGWVAGLQDSDLVINSPIKKTKVALENDRLLFWVYTDGDAMMNGYRVDFNGAEKRIYYGKITNGIYSNIGGTTLT